jgi:tricorn protease
VNKLTIALVCLTALAVLPAVADGEGYLRYPDIHGENVVFVAEADLWLAPAGGGAARRLTSHEGSEAIPRFSPDGKSIAFTGQYDGNADVFVVSAAGGEPRRLTWHPGGDYVVGWTPDGKSVLFASSRHHPHGSPEIFSVPAKGGDAEPLPLGWVTHLDIEPEGGRWAFTRTGGGGTWKRYRGGTARSIWVGDPGKADFEEVTSFDGMNAFPMWHRDRIYYLGDAGGTANIWSMKPDGSDHEQHTRFDAWDARYPAMGPDGRIVFMLAGDIHLFDPASGARGEIEISLPSDRVLTRTRYPNTAGSINWFELSPDGSRLAVTARGEIFSVPVKEGVTLPVTRGSGARESWGSFDSEGKRLVYVTDEPREEEIRIVDAWGRGEATTVLPAGRSGWHFPPAFSPDDEWIAYADQTQTLWIVAAKGGKPKKVDRCDQWRITDYAWSPDSRWLAYTKMSRTDYRSIYLYDRENDEVHRVTEDSTDDFSPAWDPDGRYLHFLSDRYTNPLLGVRDRQIVNINPTLPFLALLREDVENPFASRAGVPPQDEDEAEEEKEEAETEEDEKEAGEDEKKAKPVEIELEGLADRVVQLPVEPGQYSALSATKSHVFYVSSPLTGMADWGPVFSTSGPPSTLVQFDLAGKKAKPFMEGVGGYDLAGDKVAIMKQPGEIYVVGAAAPPGPDLSESKVAMGGVVAEIAPEEEWAQIYYEGWRHMRDFYWDSSLGEIDWEAVRDQYATLLPRLATRGDLSDLVAEMIGELSTSHTYVFGGDPGRQVPMRPTGLLGADLSREGEAFKVERIYRGAPADNERSPLAEAGVDVSEGDYILAINHLPFAEERPFHAHLEGMAGNPILLSVNDEPSEQGAREVVVTPLTDERGVRYADWVRRNREAVAEASGGKIGYVHIPDMMQAGMIEFNTWFYPQLDLEGMVVDVRWNGGGFVSQMILERFRRAVLSFNRDRSGGVRSYPYRTLNGPFVVLTNEHAGSDGDIFPAAVQLEGLAPVIGMRSWGGVVGINSIRPMVDGGLLTQPATAWWDPEHGWELENRGVVPDIEVQNLPQQLGRGEDVQLDRAVEEVLKLHAAQPPLEPRFGPARPRGRDAYRQETASHGE